MSMPENANSSSQPSASAGASTLYLLNDRAQKLKKQPPAFRTQNEGSQHIPRFRSSVLFDGVTYTSSRTFQQKQRSVIDVAEIAYVAVTNNSKARALQTLREDKAPHCKSLVAELAAKMYIGKPVYATTAHIEGFGQVFRSSLHFNGVTYQGDRAKNKKDAEQLVARALVLRYLDSDYGYDLADMVNIKFRNHHEMRNIQQMEAQSKGAHNEPRHVQQIEAQSGEAHNEWRNFQQMEAQSEGAHSEQRNVQQMEAQSGGAHNEQRNVEQMEAQSGGAHIEPETSTVVPTQVSTHEPTKPQVTEPNGAATRDKKKKKRSEKRVKTFEINIFKVLKNVHPDLGISRKAIAVMNSFINDMLEKLADESHWLARYKKSKKITCREIENAVRLVLPCELANQASWEGTKAVTTYARS